MISESWPNAAHRRYLKTRCAHWSEPNLVLIRMPLVLSAEAPGSRKHSMRQWQSLHSWNSKEKTIRSGWHKSIKRIFPSSVSMPPGHWMPVPFKGSIKNPFRLLPKSTEPQRQQFASRCLELLLLRKFSDRLPPRLRG